MFWASEQAPTGFRAAKRLDDLVSKPIPCVDMDTLIDRKHDDWLVIDALKEVGGLASADITPDGFLCDVSALSFPRLIGVKVGGHVIFSHYKYFDDALNEALPHSDDWLIHKRVSYVRSKGFWFHTHFRIILVCFPTRSKSCVWTEWLMLLSVSTVVVNLKSLTNGSSRWWLFCHVDEGNSRWRTCRLVYASVKFQSLGCANNTYAMSMAWWTCRCSKSQDGHQNILNKTAGNWGPNATFRFPAHGGTGGIWKAAAKTLPKEKFGGY